MKIVGLCGMSGSGKTHLLASAKAAFGNNISVLSFDNYYKPITFQQKDENGFENFDLPGGVDADRLVNDLATLKSGRSIQLKAYHFNTPGAPDVYIQVDPAPLMIIEGIFVFYFKAIYEQIDYRIFLEVPDDITLNRRLKRDKEERGLDENMILYQWHAHALPGFREFVLPFKPSADLLLNNAQHGDAAAQQLNTALKTLLNN